MGSRFDNLSLVKDDDLIGVDNGTEAMGNHKTGSALHQPVKGLLN